MRLHGCAALGLGIALLASTAASAAAQTPASSVEPRTAVAAPNSVILELFGNALLYSVNYERALTPRAGVRVGMMHIQAHGGSVNQNHYGGRLTIVPVLVHYLTGAGHNHLELGAGLAVGRGHWQFDSPQTGSNNHDGGGVFGTATVGYRHQNPDGRNIFRAGLTPVFDRGGALPWFGISYGRRW